MDKKILKKIGIYLLVIFLFFFVRYNVSRIIDINNKMLGKYSVSSFYDKINEINYFVYDVELNSIIISNTVDKNIRPHDLIKLYTVYYALKNLDISDKVNVGEEINLAKGHKTLIGLKKGQYTVADLIKATMIGSGDDAAYALAKATIDKVEGKNIPVNEFIDYFKKNINEFMKKNISEDIHIEDPDGYSEKNSISMEALQKIVDVNSLLEAKLDKIILENELYSKEEDTITDSNGNVYIIKSDIGGLGVKLPSSMKIGIKTGISGSDYNCVLRIKDAKHDFIIYVGAKDEIQMYFLIEDLNGIYRNVIKVNDEER